MGSTTRLYKNDDDDDDEEDYAPIHLLNTDSSLPVATQKPTTMKTFKKGRFRTCVQVCVGVCERTTGVIIISYSYTI